MKSNTYLLNCSGLCLRSASNDEPLQFPMLTEATFEDAFGELYLGDEMRSPYDNATEVILDMRNSV